jgi:hypothetical protein
MGARVPATQLAVRLRARRAAKADEQSGAAERLNDAVHGARVRSKIVFELEQLLVERSALPQLGL